MGPAPTAGSESPNLNTKKATTKSRLDASVFALSLALSSCHRSEPSPGDSATSSREVGSAHGDSDAGAPSAGPCLAPAVVAPFAHYSDDMIRGLATDGESVYFRTIRETFRVPLAGGTPGVIGKNPPGGNGPMWVIGEDLVAQPTGSPAFVAMPKSGGAWKTFADATSDKSGGGDTLPTIFNNIHRGRIEAAQQATFDGKSFYFVEKDIAGATISGGGKTTWSVRRLGPSDAKAETLYTSERELQHLVKAGETLFFQRNETSQKPLAPGAKKPPFEETTWSLVSLSTGGGNPSLRVASVDKAALATDGVTVYYTAHPGGDAAGHFPKTSLYGLPAVATRSAQIVDDWTLEPEFGAPYGADGFVLHVHAFKDVSPTGIPSNLTTLLYLGKRSAGGQGRRVCVAQSSNAHAFAVSGSVLLFASQLNDGSGAQGIVKYALP